MRHINQNELYEIIEKHGKWLRGEGGGERADLSNADLSGFCMIGTSLTGASLDGANLTGANLTGASLDGASLTGASLAGAYLTGANLDGANLDGASLTGASLAGANLTGASLAGASLTGASLAGAYLTGAYLAGANLTGASLAGANLDGAYLDGAMDLFISLSCPSQGEFIAWKKVENKIIKLRIPDDAIRSSATTRKCRADRAFVVAIENMDGTKADIDKIVNSRYYPGIVYKVGEMVYPDSFDKNRWNECSHGIHFFIDREEAVRY